MRRAFTDASADAITLRHRRPPSVSTNVNPSCSLPPARPRTPVWVLLHATRPGPDLLPQTDRLDYTACRLAPLLRRLLAAHAAPAEHDVRLVRAAVRALQLFVGRASEVRLHVGRTAMEPLTARPLSARMDGCVYVVTQPVH